MLSGTPDSFNENFYVASYAYSSYHKCCQTNKDIISQQHK